MFYNDFAVLFVIDSLRSAQNLSSPFLLNTSAFAENVISLSYHSFSVSEVFVV